MSYELLKHTDVIVAKDASASNAIDTGAGFIVGLIIPHVVETTTARVSFLTSDTLAGTYRVVTKAGTKYGFAIAIDDHALLESPIDLVGCSRFVKVVLETSGSVAVAQSTAARTITVITSSSLD